MRTLDRYVISQFLRNLGIILAVLVALYSLIEFIERVDDFIERGAALSHYLRYPLFKLPLMATQTLPMALLLAAFATIGQLSRTQQITALRCSGIGLWEIARPLLVAGAIFCLVMLIGNGWVLPWSNREANYVLQTELAGEAPREVVTRDLYLREQQRIMRIAHAYPERGEIHGVMVLELDDQLKPVRRLDATKARYVGDGKWRLFQVKERRFGPGGQKLTGFTQSAEQLISGRDPRELSEKWADPAQLSLTELLQLSNRLQRDGQDPRRYQGELQLRIAQGFMPFIVVLLGIPFALQRGRQATFGVGVALTLGVFVTYIVLQAISMALGTAGLLPLPLAAWSANLLLLLIGSWLFLTLDN
jgi:lipopolysaccharide export system permease protein